MELQATRPQLVEFGSTSSPALPADAGDFSVDLPHTRDGMPVRTDRPIIDNLMLYWLTGTATSAARLYCEAARAGTGAVSEWTGRVDVPTGYANHPGTQPGCESQKVWAQSGR